MSQRRLAIKVGLFVLLGIVLFALLALQFSKGTTLFQSTYELRLKASNVGGLRERSSVLISGVKVGTVSEVKLSQDGKTVTLLLKIYSIYKIHGDARFVIEQSGFLGDQFISVLPTENKLPELALGSEVTADEPFNLQEAARAAAGFLQRADETVKTVKDMVDSVRIHTLNPQTLTNLSVAIANVRRVSDQAVATMGKLDALVETNTPVVSQSLSNVHDFSEKLDGAGDSLEKLIAENRPQISAAVQNIQAATVTLTNLLNDVKNGKGVAGTLISDQQVAANLSHIVENLSVTTSNLNRVGLWGILWKQHGAKPASTGTNSAPPALLRALKN